ncbi:MAG TPA: cytochrome c oxidase subunit II [Trueperaceae bacterium]
MRPRRAPSLAVAGVLAMVTLSACAGVQSALAPASTAAERIALWWWIMFWIAFAVALLVLALLLTGLARSGPRARPDITPRPDRGWMTLIVLGGIVAPVVVLGGIMGFNLVTEGAIAASARQPEMDVLVIGHQWWWEVNYPKAGFRTANEIHIPAGIPVKIKLTSADVIHSFWVPELHGKIDLIPGRTNTLVLEADKPGIYRGQCAEYCGLQHAKMAFLVFADPPEQYAAWLKGQQAAAAPPATPRQERGQQVFLSSACVYCHTVRGTNASGKLGPDLTHLASRSTLGAVSVTNSRGNLGGWIVNSQSIKPGNRMPPMVLDADDLQALLDYLQSLD